MGKKRSITDFFNNEFTQFASNDNYQSIASYIDGLKPTSRKIVHVVKKKNIVVKEKVETLANKTSEETEYLGGAGNIMGVIVNNARDYTGGNNLPLLESKGNFGTRLNPIAAAPRYIYTMKRKYFDQVIVKDDDNLLDEQTFEGTVIEPKYFVPIVPMILMNGSSGIGNGFSQDIFPREPSKLIKHLEDRLNGKPSKYDFKPYWVEFSGEVASGETPKQWTMSGKFTVKNTSTIEITELPIKYTLLAYTKVLRALRDSGKIMSFEDRSDTKTDIFHFIIKMKRSDLATMSHDDIEQLLKLKETASEVFVCMDENNMIREYESVEQIFEDFFNIRMDYYRKRKEFLINKIQTDIEILKAKASFIKHILDGNINISGTEESTIISKLEQLSVMKVDNSYDYLLNMSIRSLTKERLSELKLKYESLLKTLDDVKLKSLESLWLDDIQSLKKGIT